MTIEITHKNTLDLTPYEHEGKYKGRFIANLNVRRFMGGDRCPPISLRITSKSEEGIKDLIEKGLSFTDGMSHNVTFYAGGGGVGEVNIELFSDKEYDKLIKSLNEWSTQ